MILRASLSQAWPPFVLVTGLLLIGLVDHAEGLFAWAAARLQRARGGTRALFALSCALVAVVTALLNLDTAVVFLTPVLVLAARRRGVAERPFLYAALFMANASSLFLPGSNLTNLIVLAQEPVSGATFATRLFVPAIVAAAITALGLMVLFGRELSRPGSHAGVESAIDGDAELPRLAGTITLASAILTVALSHPALPVLTLGVLTAAIQTLRGRIRGRETLRALGPPILLALFAASTALGVLARSWAWPGHVVHAAGRWETTAIGALTAVTINNLPAAVLLSAHPIPHPRALLLGLNLGPNLAVTGSLSSYLWYQAARRTDARPSIRAITRYGILLAPAALAAALLALTILDTSS